METQLVVGKLGIKYHVLVGPDMISRQLREFGVYEPELLAITSELFAPLATETEQLRGRVLDVGANLGTFTLPLASVYTSLEFVCFEPQAPVFDLLLRNIRENALRNVTAQPYALAERAGHVQANLPDYPAEPNVGAFSLDEQVQTNDYELATRGELCTFELRTLDSFSFTQVRLIKIDVEGMELAVLRGGVTTLERNSFPPLLLEAWTWKPWYEARRKALLDWLETAGYTIEAHGPFLHVAQHPAHQSR